MWEAYFQQQGLEAIHWKNIGPANAPDREIFEYARENGFIIFTNDLDFGAILAATNTPRPSVIQARAQDLTPEFLGDQIIRCINQFQTELIEGCILTLDPAKSKVRLLPINP
jgi:predicted nuclease of predicted toxin-antitoxin system